MHLQKGQYKNRFLKMITSERGKQSGRGRVNKFFVFVLKVLYCLIWLNEKCSGVALNLNQFSRCTGLSEPLFCGVFLSTFLPPIPRNPLLAAGLAAAQEEHMLFCHYTDCRGSGSALLPAENRHSALFLALKINTNRKTGLQLLPAVAAETDAWHPDAPLCWLTR